MSLLLDCCYILVAVVLLPLWLYRLPRGVPLPGRADGAAGRLPGTAARPAAPLGALRQRRRGRHPAPPHRAHPRGDYPRWEVVFSTSTDTGARRLRELYPDAVVFYMPLDVSWCVLARAGARAAAAGHAGGAGGLAQLHAGLPQARAARGHRQRPHQRLLPALGAARAAPPAPHVGRRGRLLRPQPGRRARASSTSACRPERVVVCGSLKYDLLGGRPDAERVRRLADLFGIEEGAPVLVAGSTHRGEEAVLAAVYRDLRLRHRRLRLIIVPRHVERGDGRGRRRGRPQPARGAQDGAGRRPAGPAGRRHRGGHHRRAARLLRAGERAPSWAAACWRRAAGRT